MQNLVIIIVIGPCIGFGPERI